MSLLLQRPVAPIRWSVVVFVRNNVVPHVATYETHQRFWKISLVTQKRLFQHYPPKADILWKSAFDPEPTSCRRSLSRRRWVSGNDPLCAELAHEPHEHLFAIDHIVEAEAARFSNVRHHIPVATEDVIGKGPGHELIVSVGLQPIFLCHDAPEWCVVYHVCGKAYRLHLAGWHFESGRELRPQILPAEIVTVGDVESFEPAARRARRPERRVGEVHGFGNLVDRCIGARLSRETQRQPKLLADCGVDRDRRRQTHRRARRKAA